jgi:toxin ParE1/3/4
MVKLSYSKPALDDLKNIHDYISADSKAAAKRFVSLLKERIKILKKYPELGKPMILINSTTFISLKIFLH